MPKHKGVTLPLRYVDQALVGRHFAYEHLWAFAYEASFYDGERLCHEGTIVAYGRHSRIALGGHWGFYADCLTLLPESWAP